MRRLLPLSAALILGVSLLAPALNPPPARANGHDRWLYEFRVKWDGEYVPNIQSVTGLRRRTEVVVNRTGSDPSAFRRSPGQTAYQPIILQRPRTQDGRFESWANKVWNYGSGMGSEVSLQDFRKDVVIEYYDGLGRLAMSYKIYRCWPSEYTAADGMVIDSGDAAMEVLVLEHEGWERDYSVAPPP